MIDIGMNTSELTEAVQNETLILQRLKHPNIVDFYETFIYDDHLCILMEYCNEGIISLIFFHHNSLKVIFNKRSKKPRKMTLSFLKTKYR